MVSGVSWRPALRPPAGPHLSARRHLSDELTMEVPSLMKMKKIWLASPLLLASLCLAAQTGSSSGSSTGSQGQSATQPSSQSSTSSTSSTDQNGSSSSTATTPSTSDQSGSSATGSTGPTSSDQNATSSQSGTATGTSGKSRNGKLPQTASPLPLLGLLGLGSLGAGLLRSRKR